MATSRISYVKLKSGGYRLMNPYIFWTDIKGHDCRVTTRDGELILSLSASGHLFINAGYQWDGCSGPVFDRKSNMRAGLIHDALYQLMRTGQLPLSCRKRADEIFKELVQRDGGFRIVSWLDYAGLRLFARYAAKPRPEVEERMHWAP